MFEQYAKSALNTRFATATSNKLSTKKRGKNEFDNEEYEENEQEKSNDNEENEQEQRDEEEDEEELIDILQEKPLSNSSNIRRELFKWTFKLHKNEEYAPPEEVTNDVLLKRGSDL